MQRAMTMFVSLLFVSTIGWSCLPLEELNAVSEEEEAADDTSYREDASRLESLINGHRETLGLKPIPSSEALQKVAEAHVRDLEANYPKLPCNLHSWSKDGPWSACCYTSQNPIRECMINKPLELSSYPGEGFEIAVSRHGGPDTTIDPEFAYAMWRQSQAHYEVIVNQGSWQKRPWRAMGTAISKHYAVVWFGHESDVSIHHRDGDDDDDDETPEDSVLGWD